MNEQQEIVSALAAAAESIWEAITFGNIHRVSNQAAALRNALNAYNDLTRPSQIGTADGDRK